MKREELVRHYMDRFGLTREQAEQRANNTVPDVSGKDIVPDFAHKKEDDKK